MDKRKGSVFSRGNTDEEKTSRLVAGSIISMASTILGGLFATVWMIAMTRLLGPKDFGIFGPVHNIFWASLAIATLGINSAITTFVAHHWEKNPDEARKFSSDGAKLLLIVGIIIFCLTTITSLILFKFKVINNIVFATCIVIAGAIFFHLQALTMYGILLGFNRADLFAVGHLIFPTVQFMSAYLLVLFSQKVWGAKSYYDIVAATSGMLFGGAANFFVGSKILKKVDLQTYNSLYNWKKKYGLFKKIIIFGGITTIANVSYNTFTNIPSIIVGIIAIKWAIYATTKNLNLEQSGFFSATFLFAQAAMMIMGLVFPLVPAMSEAESQGRKDLLQHYHDLILKTAVMIVVIIFIIYCIAGGHLVNLLAGSKYPIKAVEGLAKILSLGVCMLALFFLYLNIFIGIKKPQLGAVAIFIAVVLQMILIICLSLILKSIIAPAIGFTFSSFVAFFISIIYISRVEHIKIKLPLFVVPLLIGLFSYSIAVRFIWNIARSLFASVRHPFPIAGFTALGAIIIYLILFVVADRVYLNKIAPVKLPSNSKSN